MRLSVDVESYKFCLLSFNTVLSEIAYAEKSNIMNGVGELYEDDGAFELNYTDSSGIEIIFKVIPMSEIALFDKLSHKLTLAWWKFLSMFNIEKKGTIKEYNQPN